MEDSIDFSPFIAGNEEIRAKYNRLIYLIKKGKNTNSQLLPQRFIPDIERENLKNIIQSFKN